MSDSILISLDFNSGELFDKLEPRKESDVEKFAKRMKQDKINSPARDLHGFQLFKNKTPQEIKV